MTMENKLKTEIVIAASVVLGWIGIGTIISHRLESWTWIQSFYFSVVTLTTVGYGDLVPSTDATRLFVAIYILVGVGMVFTALGIIGANMIAAREQRFIKRENRKVKK